MVLLQNAAPPNRRLELAVGGQLSDEFRRQVRDALARLYDPVAMQTHPLTRYLQQTGLRPPRLGEALRQELRTAIESTRPRDDAVTDPAAWRRYRSLILRYVEARDAHAVQDELAISQSTYYREHHRALEAVALVLHARRHPTESGESAETPPGTLAQGSAPLTRFVGRAAELAEIERAVSTTRLVTLTGTGGCGKTRLALQVAARLAERSSLGSVWVIDLASLADPALVPSTVAAAIGVREEPGQPIVETLVAALSSWRSLIVLDNCEHVLDACAHLADTLLHRCPGLRILATSREALGVAGEVSRRVPPLEAPPLEPLPPIERLRAYEAVQLFADRAAAVQPAFAVTEQNAAAVAQVCTRLDGIPLALELAAARLGGLTVEQLASRLDRRFRLLTGGSRTALPHHQTLRATIDWSYDLLPAPERVLFDRLALFSGGWTIEAVEAVCIGDGLVRDEVLALLLRLVDKSLVVADDVVTADRGAEKRYRLLDTLREYGRERLAACGEVEAIYGRHAAYYGAIAAEAEPHLLGPLQLPWLDRLEVEHDNVRAALRWLQDAGRLDDAVRLGGALHWFWFFRGHGEEERAWLAQVFAAGAVRPRSAAWAKVLVLARDPVIRGREKYENRRSLVEEGLAIAREVRDDRVVAQGLMTLASISWQQGDVIAARDSYAESLAIYRRLGDAWGMSMSLSYIGRALQRIGNGEAARAALDEAIAHARLTGERRALALALEYTGELTMSLGAYGEAHERLCEGLALYRELGVTVGIAMVQKLLGRLAYLQGDLGAAGRWFRASLTALRDLPRTPESWWAIEAIEGLAMVAAAQGQPERALRLAASTVALRDARSLGPDPSQRAELDDSLRHMQCAMEDHTATDAWAAGQAMTREQAIGYGLEADDRALIGPSR